MQPASQRTQQTALVRPPAQPVNFVHPPFAPAPVLRSAPESRTLQAQLVATYGPRPFTTFHQGQQVALQLLLRGYNGLPVGPTLVARPGDTLLIRLRNELPPEQHQSHCDDPAAKHEAGCLHNIPHNFNTTNLHTHGLHVDPTGSSDNALITLRRGEQFDYRIEIPEDHPAGTFWYHAHVHGATSVQVGSGMAGMLIIEGDYDALPQLRRAEQRVLMLQEVAFDESGRIEDNHTYAPTIWDDEAAARGWHIAINGQVMPELRLRPGELQLWRTVNAGVRKLINLQLVPACRPSQPVPLVQLAADGIPFPHKRLSEDRGAFLTPGSRLDLAVRAVQPGVYYLVDTLERASSGPLPQHYCDRRRGDAPLRLDDYAQGILARVVVSGPPRWMSYPRNAQLARLARPAPIEDRELAATTQRVDFDIDLSHDPWLGLVNGVPYDPNQPRRLKLGEAETWYLASAFSHHPFHIHVNPFEVIRRDARGNIIDRFWKDTINVPETDPNNVFGTTLEIRMRYADFSGAFVAHCHILDHSDRGMMEKIVIEP